VYKDLNIPVEDFTLAMEEMSQHQVLVDTCNLIYRFGLHRVLTSLADYCADNKESFALSLLAEFYKENESAICKDAPTMQ
jgi:hypothetical protein